MARILLKGITKTFGDVVAVNELTLDIKDKDFVVFLGPSGCGKTTSLRCIAGLEAIDSGEIYIGDTLVNDLEPKDRNVAMVFQNYALYPHMTVYKNLSFPLENFRYPVGEIQKRIGEVAKLLQIEALLYRKPTELSGGQQQRVALGRAIVREPQAFLMDEPLSNLDAKLRIHMRAELKRLQKDLGITTVYVTHDQVEAMTMGDSIAIMNGGILQQKDDPSNIYTHPANRFVAGFIGSPPFNFFECTLASAETLQAEEFTYPLRNDLVQAAKDATSDELVLGIRPQDIEVLESPGDNGDLIEAQVYTTEPLGDTMIIDFEIGDALTKAVVPPDFDATIGDKLWLRFPPEKVYLFDKATEAALT